MWFRTTDGDMRNLSKADGFPVKQLDDGTWMLYADGLPEGELYEGTEESCLKIKAYIEDELLRPGLDLSNPDTLLQFVDGSIVVDDPEDTER